MLGNGTLIRKLLKRLLNLVIVIWGVVTLSFCLQVFTGTDPAEMIVRKNYLFATEEQIQAVRIELGLDAPFHERYLDYIAGVFHGDLGTAITNRKPVIQNIREALPVTCAMIMMTMAWIVLFTVLIAAVSVMRKGGIFDHTARVLCIIGICVPSFWLALILLSAFAVKIPVFRVIADGSVKSLILPSVSMAVPIICIAARVLRASILNELKSDYVTYARARGFSDAQIVYSEVLRNALPSAITLFAQYCAALFGTSALVESVFSIDGLGSYLMKSCEGMDIYGISGAILVCAVLFVLFNAIADILSCCQRQPEIVRKRRRNFVDFRRGVTEIRCCLVRKGYSRFAVSGA